MFNYIYIYINMSVYIYNYVYMYIYITHYVWILIMGWMTITHMPLQRLWHRCIAIMSPLVSHHIPFDSRVTWSQWEIFRIQYMEVRKRTIFLAIFCGDIP